MGYVLRHAKRSEPGRISMEASLRTGVAGGPILAGWPGCELSGEATYIRYRSPEFGQTYSVWESMSLTFVVMALGDQLSAPRRDETLSLERGFGAALAKVRHGDVNLDYQLRVETTARILRRTIATRRSR